MPLLESEASPRGRMRVFVRAQLPLLLGAAFIGVVVAVAVAVADIVGLALLRAELLAVLPSVGMLATFPILWLAYGFRRTVVLVTRGKCTGPTVHSSARSWWRTTSRNSRRPSRSARIFSARSPMSCGRR
ncbi:hypothetical protein ELQ92_01960 [Labedella populi]|uniref:Uncharacterized protein n=1 Tax=Labedella populi TaxID=2498850 RepID=A0A444QEP0_9MICO|nr:hypothetical protein [Labedella populi]RWZ68043.1 hypothetical protein ELQ92_01960 [Labedella populi]